jgi:hypothetical protein
MRIRSVKPELLRDQWLQRQDPLTRVVMVGLLMTADDSGKYEADRDVLRGQIAPCDHPKAFNASYDVLLGAKKVLEYESEMNRYGVIPMFAVHQRIDKPQRSELPNPPPEMTEALIVRLTTHPKWKKVHRQNLLRMVGETAENIQRIFREDSENVLGTFQDDSCASRARASGSMEEEQGKGRGKGEYTRFGNLYQAWLGIHAECRKVSLEHFVEIVRLNPKADVPGLLERLRMELKDQEWPRNKTPPQLLRSRIVFAEVDSEREREAMGKTGAAGGLTAEELRAKAERMGGTTGLRTMDNGTTD